MCAVPNRGGDSLVTTGGGCKSGFLGDLGTLCLHLCSETQSPQSSLLGREEGMCVSSDSITALRKRKVCLSLSLCQRDSQNLGVVWLGRDI